MTDGGDDRDKTQSTVTNIQFKKQCVCSKTLKTLLMKVSTIKAEEGGEKAKRGEH